MSEEMKDFVMPTEEELKNATPLNDNMFELGDSELEDISGGKIVDRTTGMATTKLEAELFIKTYVRLNHVYKLKSNGKKIITVSTGVKQFGKTWVGAIYYQAYDASRGGGYGPIFWCVFSDIK